MNLRSRSLLIALLLLVGQLAQAQIGGGGGGGGIGGGGGGNNIAGSGVVVDANGVLRRVTSQDATGQLARQRASEAIARLDGNLAKPSKFRKVSLTRLEKLLAQKLAAGSGPDEAMKALAGLTRIDYVFCYPAVDSGERGDVVLAGPAEPWGEVPDNRLRGVNSGRPVIELQDLIVVALRHLAPEARNNNPLIYCSIDPTPEGLARMQQFLHPVRPASRRRTTTQFIVERTARETRPASDHRRRRPAEDALRAGDGRSRLSDEADRHRPGTAAGATHQLC